MKKITIAQGLKEYTKDELRQFHANLTAIFTSTQHDEPLSVFALILEVTNELQERKDTKYLDALSKLLDS